MDTPDEYSAAEVAQLRTCLSDLAGILALPARWADREPAQIVSALLDALLATLRLDFGYARLNDQEAGRSIELVRIAESLYGVAGPSEISQVLDVALGDAPSPPPRTRAVLRDIEVSVAWAPLGLRGELGIVAAGSPRTDFPTQTERLVLDVAANQAAIGLQHARLLHERGHESRVLMDNIPGLVAIMSPVGELQFANRGIIDYTGRPLEELKQWGTNDTVHPEDLPQVIQIFSESIASGTPYGIVQRLRRADGAYLWFQNDGFPLRDASGRIDRWCVLLTDIDERKRAEDALRESSDASRLIVESIPGVVAVFSPDGVVELVNPQGIEFFGRTLEELTRWESGAMTHPDDLARVTELFARAIASGEPFDWEVRARRSDGVYRWLQSRGAPLRDTNGQIVRWYNLLIDIDERKRAEEALAASERNLKLSIDTMPALAWSASASGEAEFFNQHYLEFIGLSAEQASGWGWTAAVHPEDVNDLAATWQRIMASEAPGEAEARLRGRDGSYRWFLFRANPLRDETGAVVKWYGINTDIEDRKQAEAELRRAYDSFAEALRLSKTGNFTADIVADDHIWSEQLYRIFEIDPATKITVQAVRDIIHHEDLPSFDAGFARSLGGVDFDLVFRIIPTGGTLKHVHAVGHVVERVAGRPLFIGAIQDITERVAAEQALNRARTELAHVSRVTTVSALTASIAHEVNQPLSGIITNASTGLRMLDADPPNVDGARETVRRTIRDGRRAADVIARLRALFSRKELTRELLDLNEATQEVIALSLSELQRNHVVLQAELGDDLPHVTGDRIQLQQVILNLVRNASDAMVDVHDRPRQLLIKTEAESGDRVRLTVRDAGVGLPPQSLSSLFDPFSTTKSDGMGIGLFVSRSIVERHQGRLWAEPNDSGPGATFSLSIPRDADSDPEATPVARPL